MPKVGVLDVLLRGDNTHLKRTMDATVRDIQRTQRSLKQLGTDISVSVGAPIAAALGYSMDLGKSFLGSMTRVKMGVPDAANAVEAMREEILALAKDLAIDPNTVVDSLSTISRQYRNQAEWAARLAIANRAAVESISDVGDVTKVVSSVARAFNEETVEGYKRTADMAVRMTQLSSTKFEGLLNPMARVSAMAHGLGISMEELWASMATLALVSGDATLAAQGLVSIFRGGYKPSEDLRNVLAKIQLSLKDYSLTSMEALIRSKGLSTAFEMVIAQTDGTAESFGKLFPAMRGLSGAMAFAGNISGLFKKNLADMGTAATSANKALDIYKSTLGYMIDRMQTRIKLLGITIGTALRDRIKEVIPRLEKFADAIEGLTRKFSQLPASTQRTILGIAGALAALGPVMYIAGKLGSMAIVFARALQFLLSPLGLLITASALLVINWKKVANILGLNSERVSAIANVLKVAGGKVLEILGKVGAWVTTAGRNIIAFFRFTIPIALKTAWAAVGPFFANIAKGLAWIVDKFGGDEIADSMRQWAEKVGATTQQEIEDLKRRREEYAAGNVDVAMKVQQFIVGLPAAIARGVMGVWAYISRFFNDLRSEAVGAAADLSGLTGAVEGQAQAVGESVMNPRSGWRLWYEKIKEYLSKQAHSVQGFQDTIRAWGNTIADEFTNAIMFAQNWGEAMHNIIKQVIQDIVRMIVMAKIAQPFMNWLSGFLGFPKMSVESGDIIDYGEWNTQQPGVSGTTDIYGQPQIVINDNRGAPGSSPIKAAAGGSGSNQIIVAVTDAWNAAAERGAFDEGMSRRWRAKRRVA